MLIDDPIPLTYHNSLKGLLALSARDRKGEGAVTDASPLH
jgi:hypothetical protein